jgi:endonuclease/exonuclease/phosphatase family metal-dependent hydrolase
MRIATFNILHGRTVDDGVVDLDRLRAAVRDIDADVLALQEVDRDQPRSQHADLTAVAAEAMGAVSYRFVAALAGTPGATWSAATGTEQPGTATYGVALLSRYPALNWQVLRLPRIPFRFPMYLPGPNRVMVVREEPRAVVVARLETPMGQLTVASTHLSFVPGWNRMQLRRLRRDLEALPGPRLLLGDFNLTPPTPAARSGLESLGAADTFPAERPSRQLDHVLVSPGTLRTVAVRAPAMSISDHRPLIIDVEPVGSTFRSGGERGGGVG